MSEPLVWFAEDRAQRDPQPKTPNRWEQMRDRSIEEARRTKAIGEARAYYRACAPLRGGHPYLQSHGLGVEGCHSLRVDSVGWLVAPMHRAHGIVSLQRISPEGEKRFWAGAPSGSTHLIISHHRPTLTILTEGLATGLALYAAVPNSEVVVTYTASNLPKVAKRLAVRGFCVVAADNDHETEKRTGRNPGVLAAQEAAEILRCGVAVPEGITGTDWCDYRQERFRIRHAIRSYGKRPITDSDLRRSVDGEIQRALANQQAYIIPRDHGPSRDHAAEG
jgi:putative DNA primase/helicase